MKTAVGRIVHYHTHTAPGQEILSEALAAVITRRSAMGTIDLFVMAPDGTFPVRNVSAGGPDGTTPTPGCWTWPPRE